MKKYVLPIVALVLISLVVTVPAAGIVRGVASEIGPSVQFEKGVRISMFDLRGKVVLFLFFQPSNQECNKLSKRLFQQIQKAADGRSDVILIALWTGSKRIKDAKKYLKGKVDFSKWLVGVDLNAAYCQSAVGNSRVFQYCIVSPSGRIKYIGGAAAFEEEDGKKTDAITATELKTYIAKLKTSPLLPRDKSYQKSLASAVRLAEQGRYSEALLECKRHARRSRTRDDAAALRKDILEFLDKKIKAKIEIVNNTSAKSSARYEALLALHNLGRLRKLPAGKDLKEAIEQLQKTVKEAQKTIKAAAKDPNLAKEQKAHNAYMKLQNKVKRLQKIAKNKSCRAAFGKIVEKFPDTLFGKMAKDTAYRMKKN